jgi:hypothetical protein
VSCVKSLCGKSANIPIGVYRERLGNTDVDCRKIIWILATNKGDTAVSKFHAEHIAKCKEEDIDQVSIEPLRQKLRKLFTSLYSVSLCAVSLYSHRIHANTRLYSLR